MSHLILYRRVQGQTQAQRVKWGSDTDPEALWVFLPSSRTLQVQDGSQRYLTNDLGLTPSVSAAATFNIRATSIREQTIVPDNSQLLQSMNAGNSSRLTLSNPSPVTNPPRTNNLSSRTRTLASDGVPGTIRPDITNKQSCLAINAYWVPDTVDPAQGVCYGCQVGSQYPDKVNNVCYPCSLNGKCGDQNGYCSGTTGPAGTSIPCTQNTLTETFSPSCNNQCEGQCSGSCGGLVVIGYTCQKDPNTGFNTCMFDPTKWWVILLWVIAGVVILALIAYGIAAAARKKRVAKREITVSKEIVTTTTPTVTVQPVTVSVQPVGTVQSPYLLGQPTVQETLNPIYGPTNNSIPVYGSTTTTNISRQILV